MLQLSRHRLNQRHGARELFQAIEGGSLIAHANIVKIILDAVKFNTSGDCCVGGGGWCCSEESATPGSGATEVGAEFWPWVVTLTVSCLAPFVWRLGP